MKFNAIGRALQHVLHFGRRKECFVCACDVPHYRSFQAAAVKHEIHRLSSVYIVLLYDLEANFNS